MTLYPVEMLHLSSGMVTKLGVSRGNVTPILWNGYMKSSRFRKMCRNNGVTHIITDTTCAGESFLRAQKYETLGYASERSHPNENSTTHHNPPQLSTTHHNQIQPVTTRHNQIQLSTTQHNSAQPTTTHHNPAKTQKILRTSRHRVDLDRALFLK